MDIVEISIYVVLGLVGVSLLTLLVFGIRSLSFGKIKISTIIMVTAPLILMVALGMGLSGDSPWERAALYTLLIMIVLSIGTMLAASLKGFVS